jgi:general secretion pathway protein G
MKRTARADMERFANAVDQYAKRAGEPPTTEQGLAALMSKPPELPDDKWAGPYIKGTAPSKDPWGVEYRYVGLGPKDYGIWSCGPDGIDGTDDDIGIGYRGNRE